MTAYCIEILYYWLNQDVSNGLPDIIELAC